MNLSAWQWHKKLWTFKRFCWMNKQMKAVLYFLKSCFLLGPLLCFSSFCCLLLLMHACRGTLKRSLDGARPTTHRPLTIHKGKRETLFVSPFWGCSAFPSYQMFGRWYLILMPVVFNHNFANGLWPTQLGSILLLYVTFFFFFSVTWVSYLYLIGNWVILSQETQKQFRCWRITGVKLEGYSSRD